MKMNLTNWSADAPVRVAGTRLSPSNAHRSGDVIELRLRTWASALLPLFVGAMTTFAAAPTVVTSAVIAGGRQTGSSVVVDSAIGGLGGSASVGTFLARHGVAGQLTDLQGVTVSAASTTVNEGTTSQLAATATFTDSTVLPLAAASVTWTVSSGALASVSVAGLATAATVHQSTNGIARADYLGQFSMLTLSVLNLNTDDFSTYAGDTIDDAWQVVHFGLGSASAAANADPDGDGLNNLLEYLAGTTPTSAASAFNVGISAASIVPPTVNFSPLAAGRTYTVEFTTNLATRQFSALPFGSVSETNGIRYMKDDTATNAARFYRIRISLP